MVERVETYEQWEEEGRRRFVKIFTELQAKVTRLMEEELKDWADRAPAGIKGGEAIKLAVKFLPPELRQMIHDAVQAFQETGKVAMAIPLSPEAESAIANGEPVQAVDLGKDVRLTISKLVFDLFLKCLRGYVATFADMSRTDEAKSLRAWIGFLEATEKAEN